MAWIESHQALGRHPKTSRAAKLLDASRVAVVGHLHFLWWWCLDFAQDGDLSGYDDDEIADAAEWEGDSVTFVAALMGAGFITDSRQIHDWHDYAGKLVEQRKANAEKQKRWRDRNKTAGDMPHNGDVTVTSPLRNGATVPNSTVPNSTEPIKVGGTTSVGDPPPPKRATRATPTPDEFPITPERQAWADEHAPGVDVEAETQRFLDRNRAKGETYKDWEAAWRNWLTSPYAKAPQRPGGISPARASPNGHGRVSAVDTMAAMARKFREEEARESRDVPGALDATFSVRAASH